MNNSECILHPGNLQDLVCTYDTCQHKLICQQCANIHYEIHDEDYIYEFKKLTDIHKGSKFTELKKQLVAEKDVLEKALRSKLDSTGPSGRLQAKVKECEEQIGQAVQTYIRDATREVKAIIQQYQGNLSKSELTNPERMIPKIVKQLKNEATLVDQCRRDSRSKLRTLHEWVERGLDEIQLFDYEIGIIIDTIDKRKEEVLKRLKENFKNDDTNQQIHLDISVHNLALDRNDSFEAKYTKMKRVGWQNQRLSVEIEKLNKRLEAKDKKMETYEKEVQDLLTKIKNIQNELNTQTKKYIMLEKSRELELMKEQQLQKDEKNQLQQLLIHKGVDMSSETTNEINLKNKGIIENEFDTISKHFPNIKSLDIGQNKLTQQQLQPIFNFRNLQGLHLNFLKLSSKFIQKMVVTHNRVSSLSLDSNNIDDDMIPTICTLQLKSLSLIDNMITDTGAMTIANRQESLLELYLSYNQLTFKSVESISRFLFNLKKLHLAKNKVKNRGTADIAKGLKDLEELFLGGCEITKEGCLPIARNLGKLKKLSLGKNELSTDVIFELIMYLNDLEWLDVSFSDLTDLDVDRIQRLCSNNSKLHIVTDQR